MQRLLCASGPGSSRPVWGARPPKLAVFVDAASESHTYVFLRARWRMVHASLSLISVWRGWPPAVAHLCHAVPRGGGIASRLSAFSSSCLFIPSVYTDACTRQSRTPQSPSGYLCQGCPLVPNTFPMRYFRKPQEAVMSTTTRATIDDLHKVEGKAELVNGEIVEMPPSGDEPGRASLRVAARLLAYEERTGTGRAYPDGTGFHVNLPHRAAFSPDAAYHIGPPTGMEFLEGAPVFAVEDGASLTMVRQPNER